MVFCLTLLGWHVWTTQQRNCRPATLEAGPLPCVNLNEADHAQLLQLPGIGENLARHIETYREENHGFRSVDDLRHVGGIGPALLAKLRPFVYVETSDSDEEAETIRFAGTEMTKEKPSFSATPKKGALAERIDINRASVADLCRLPGIGPKLSERILDARRNKPFRTIEELRRVPGIGPKKLQALREHLVVVPQ